jgi:hypothetical protein
MTRHWLVMENMGDGARAPYVARLAGAGRHLAKTHLTTDELIATTRHRTHTAAAAFERQVTRLLAGAQTLLVAAGAHVTAGAALYRQPTQH